MLLCALFVFGMPQRALAWGPGDLFQVTLAFVTNLTVHESGHYIVAEGLGAQDNTLSFFSQDDGSFFLGLSTVRTIGEGARLPYILGGEMATSLSFEIVLHRYRAVPTPYNKALLFFNGTEFLWYSIYAFYISNAMDNRHDPVAISHETGLSTEAILVIAGTQTLLNAYRVISGQDRFVPYFTFDRYSASMWIGVRF